MILNGNQRGGGSKLAAHLMNERDNDHVEVHELRGFIADDLSGAFQEADAISKGTQCQQYLFSLSISPPKTEKVSTQDILEAVERIETKLGFEDQARAIVFHAKNGRRHAHVVWSRIDVLEMKAINLPFYHNRLTEISKDIFLEHGWRLPDGLRDKRKRDPRNFTLEEWQQAKRQGKDARDIKRLFQEAWSASDTKEAFANALEEKGYLLARGDRRGFVAVDVNGEVYAIPKWTALKTKQVREKLGDPKTLRSVDEANVHFAKQMQPALSSWQAEIGKKKQELNAKANDKHKALIDSQRKARVQLKSQLEVRRLDEAQQRQSRFRVGLKGYWDALRGAHKKISQQNEAEAWQALKRDEKRTDEMIFQHLEERHALDRARRDDLVHLDHERRELKLDRKRFADLQSKEDAQSREEPTFER